LRARFVVVKSLRNRGGIAKGSVASTQRKTWSSKKGSNFLGFFSSTQSVVAHQGTKFEGLAEMEIIKLENVAQFGLNVSKYFKATSYYSLISYHLFHWSLRNRINF